LAIRGVVLVNDTPPWLRKIGERMFGLCDAVMMAGVLWEIKGVFEAIVVGPVLH
jgi:hypothetical protein